MMAAYPCAQCEMSQRNSIHRNRQQFGYHVYVPRPDVETETASGLLEALKELTDCPAMWVTHYSGNADRGEHIKHVQCICCAADKGKAHLDECHVGRAEKAIAQAQEGK